MGDISSCQLTARIFFIFFLLALTSVLLTICELYIGTVGVILVVMLTIGLLCGCFCRYIYALDHHCRTNALSRSSSVAAAAGGATRDLEGRHYSHTRHFSRTHCPADSRHAPPGAAHRQPVGSAAFKYSTKTFGSSGRGGNYKRASEEEKLEQIRAILTRELAGRAFPLDETTLPTISLIAAAAKTTRNLYTSKAYQQEKMVQTNNNNNLLQLGGDESKSGPHVKTQLRGKYEKWAQNARQQAECVAVTIDPLTGHKSEVVSRDRSLSL